jgi:hypothetical protein
VTIEESDEDLVELILFSLSISSELLKIIFYSRSIIVLIVTITICCIQQSKASDERPSLECLASYSKSKGFNEPEFDSIDYDSTREECKKAIEEFSARVRGDIVEKMSEISTDKEQTTCINDKFTKDDTFVNNIIKGEALASLDDKEKSEKLKGIENFAEEFITSAITACLEIKEKET